MHEFWNRLAAFFGRGGRDRDLDAELEEHIALATDDNLLAGMTPAEARRQAILRFGGLESAKELHRDTRSLPFLEYLLQDLRYSFRAMRREPGFTLFAVLIAGLGIGASVTVFSVLSAVLVRPLPFHEPDRLVWIANASTTNNLSGQTLQVLPFLDYKQRNKSFSDVAAYFAFYGVGDSKLSVNGESERLNAVPVSQNFFALLGVNPQLGRWFNDDECKWNGPKAVLLSNGLWQRRFASDPRVVGSRITLDDAPVTVAGILPASFDFGSVFAPGTHVDVYSPFPLTPETDKWGNTISVVGRLKPGANIARAQAEADVLSKQISDERNKSNGLNLTLGFLREHVSGKLRPALFVLACAVGVVMLIVCANLSNLLLARSISRQKEFAIRSAVGASRERLIRQILTESIVLSCCGALMGCALAFAGTRGLSHLSSFNIPLLTEVHIDPAALFFTLALALLTGIVFGILPALQVPRITVSKSLKEQSRSSTDSRQHHWIRNTLVISEIAFACMLMVGTGLLLKASCACWMSI